MSFDHKIKVSKANELALKYSNYNTIVDFLTNDISIKTLERLESIDWKKFNSVPKFIRNTSFGGYKWNTCSGRHPLQIKKDLTMAMINKDVDTFIKCLNELLGNCCINTIDDLDEV